ncbi:DUF6838 family protein [Paenibacillus sp. 32O-W]|uniref:phage tail terminator family protein n=1 Tax=Paenibacillus sp. 32O-W TaxID=1695218 RepID=UPI0011A26FBC|nr:DUF1963 domain-containing protein [Paenibacillus sp. 32O-W]
MLTLRQIDKAITGLLLKNFPNIEVQESDVEEGFQRPSFFVSLETNRTETFQFNRVRDMTCRIYYFPSDRYVYSAEVQDVQDQLESIFGLNFKVEDRIITIDDAESYEVDKVLQYSFDFTYYEDTGEEEKGEKMKELSYNE